MSNTDLQPALVLPNPQQEVDRIIQFITNTYQRQQSTQGVIAVSGGIDSAVSLTLLTKALGAENVHPLFLPYGTQSTVDAELVVRWNKIPERNWRSLNIEQVVKTTAELLNLNLNPTEPAIQLRLGNIMARVRMIVVYDLAKELSALVCGTENKSEKYLGYFTRFGDEASDLEPLQHLYKTQVRQIALELALPNKIQHKAPSAGLWQDQTDEAELGFSYLEADQVISAVIDQNQAPATLKIQGIDQVTVQKVVARITQMAFKHQVPFLLAEEKVEPR